MREQEMKAAVVIFPDFIGYASPELNQAIELACGQLYEFVNYLQVLDPQLKRHEATIMAAAILQGLPQLFENNPAIVAAVKGECEAFRKKPNLKLRSRMPKTNSKNCLTRHCLTQQTF